MTCKLKKRKGQQAEEEKTVCMCTLINLTGPAQQPPSDESGRTPGAQNCLFRPPTPAAFLQHHHRQPNLFPRGRTAFLEVAYIFRVTAHKHQSQQRIGRSFWSRPCRHILIHEQLQLQRLQIAIEPSCSAPQHTAPHQSRLQLFAPLGWPSPFRNVSRFHKPVLVLEWQFVKSRTILGRPSPRAEGGLFSVPFANAI